MSGNALVCVCVAVSLVPPLHPPFLKPTGVRRNWRLAAKRAPGGGRGGILIHHAGH